MTNKELKSFDVFDTAIIRAVYEPKDIFTLIEQKVGKDFYKKRVDAEIKLKKTNRFCTLKDIYQLLPEFDPSLYPSVKSSGPEIVSSIKNLNGVAATLFKKCSLCKFPRVTLLSV